MVTLTHVFGAKITKSNVFPEHYALYYSAFDLVFEILYRNEEMNKIYHLSYFCNSGLSENTSNDSLLDGTQFHSLFR